MALIEHNYPYNEASQEFLSHDGSWKEISTEAMVETTYVDLKALQDNNELKPGQFYRITDYQTTTRQANTRSANH